MGETRGEPWILHGLSKKKREFQKGKDSQENQGRKSDGWEQ